MADPLDAIRSITESPQLYVRQRKEWTEILVDWETSNRYEIFDPSERSVGFAAERRGSFWNSLSRGVLRSHRPLEIDVLDRSGQAVLRFGRRFFWFFSELAVDTAEGRHLGDVRRRFAILYKKYDLVDAHGRQFACIRAPLWRIWTFPLLDLAGSRVGEISKKWSGLLREAFSDADCFLVNYGQAPWDDEQRAVILAAAISIDFDFFENNQGRQGGVLGLGSG